MPSWIGVAVSATQETGLQLVTSSVSCGMWSSCDGIWSITFTRWRIALLFTPHHTNVNKTKGTRRYCWGQNNTPNPWFSQKKFSLSKDFSSPKGNFLLCGVFFWVGNVPRQPKRYLWGRKSVERENFFWENFTDFAFCFDLNNSATDHGFLKLWGGAYQRALWAIKPQPGFGYGIQNVHTG